MGRAEVKEVAFVRIQAQRKKLPMLFSCQNGHWIGNMCGMVHWERMRMSRATRSTLVTLSSVRGPLLMSFGLRRLAFAVLFLVFLPAVPIHAFLDYRRKKIIVGSLIPDCSRELN